MEHEILFAGFGGQGVLLAGRMLVYAGMMAGKEVSWIPAYGPEQRGGTASCSVIISDEPVGCPIVTKPSALVVLNEPSLDRFEAAVRPGGVLIINSSLVRRKCMRTDVEAFYVPMNDIAAECGNVRYLNMIALGSLACAIAAVPDEFLQKAFVKQFGGKPGMVEANRQAAMIGAQCIKNARRMAGVR